MTTTDTATRVATIIAGWLETPREIGPDDTMADLGLTCEAVLASIQCEIEEEVLGHEFACPIVVHQDATVADLVDAVEAGRVLG